MSHPICSEKACPNRATQRGMCNTHYKRAVRAGQFEGVQRNSKRRHGTRAEYQRGCRCERCVTENREWQRAYRAGEVSAHRYLTAFEAYASLPVMPAELVRQGACVGKPTNMFFPEVGDNWTNTEAAKTICAECPVRRQCLDYALSLPKWADHGIWGGTSQRDRRALRSERHRARAL